MKNRLIDRVRRNESVAPQAMRDDVPMSLRMMRRIRGGEPVATPKTEDPDKGRRGIINRFILRNRDKAKEKALDDAAFFGMREDGKMIDGWPIK